MTVMWLKLQTFTFLTIFGCKILLVIGKSCPLPHACHIGYRQKSGRLKKKKIIKLWRLINFQCPLLHQQLNIWLRLHQQLNIWLMAKTAQFREIRDVLCYSYISCPFCLVNVCYRQISFSEIPFNHAKLFLAKLFFSKCLPSLRFKFFKTNVYK